ncbi:MAG TPA: dUTP diphosphatase [Tepidiformaceae bacterium]|nr:dUTP diphosphatase [Tepidiformaceae bacterium]
MSDVTIRVKLLHPNAKLPLRATEHASGADLYACLDEPVVLTQRPKLVGTGLAMEVPPGFDAQIRPRSGLARQGVLSTFGTLDADYRGELMVAMYTTAPDVTYVVHDGDRIAQLVISRLVAADFEGAAELSATGRGAGGHGSTGR